MDPTGTHSAALTLTGAVGQDNSSQRTRGGEGSLGPAAATPARRHRLNLPCQPPPFPPHAERPSSPPITSRNVARWQTTASQR